MIELSFWLLGVAIGMVLASVLIRKEGSSDVVISLREGRIHLTGEPTPEQVTAIRTLLERAYAEQEGSFLPWESTERARAR